MAKVITQTKDLVTEWTPWVYRDAPAASTAPPTAAPVEPPAPTDAAIQAELITLRLAVAEAGRAAHEQKLALYAQLERYKEQARDAAELPSIRAAARRFLGPNKKG